jgi:hypothetical protein
VPNAGSPPSPGPPSSSRRGARRPSRLSAGPPGKPSHRSQTSRLREFAGTLPAAGWRVKPDLGQGRVHLTSSCKALPEVMSIPRSPLQPIAPPDRRPWESYRHEKAISGSITSNVAVEPQSTLGAQRTPSISGASRNAVWGKGGAVPSRASLAYPESLALSAISAIFAVK